MAVVSGSSVPGQRGEDADPARKLGEAVDSPVMAAPGLAGRQYLVHRDKRGPWIQPAHPLASQQEWCLSLSVASSGRPAVIFLP